MMKCGACSNRSPRQQEPKADLWTVLQITEEHFNVEEKDVFPLAERLMEKDELVRLGAQNESA